MLELLEKKAPGLKSPAIVVEGITKEFAIPHERRTTLFESVRGMFRPSTYERFVALKDVSFTVEKGEAVGIIGDNGSGKSTLLKLIAGILRPTRGSICVNGRITPFLELGVGFQPELTARENIEVYGTIMGLTDREIKKNIGNVLEFAGLSMFEDTKLKNLSSGMQVRLAFATAIQRDPDILIVDEAIAVGDMEFQQKCLDTFHRFRDRGVTILFVSHSLNLVRNFCDKVLLLKGGEAAAFGEANRVIDEYTYGPRGHPEAEEPPENKKAGSGKVVITGLQFIDKFGSGNSNFISGDPMALRISFDMKADVGGLTIAVVFYTDGGVYCYGTNTRFKKYRLEGLKEHNVLDLAIERIPMFDGRYYVTVAAFSPEEVYDLHDKSYSFVVHNPTEDLGLFEVPCHWKSG